jgi:hypothetical protein
MFTTTRETALMSDDDHLNAGWMSKNNSLVIPEELCGHWLQTRLLSSINWIGTILIGTGITGQTGKDENVQPSHQLQER